VSAALVEELRAEVESLRELARGATATALALTAERDVLRAQLAPLCAVHDALVAAAALPGAGASPEAMVAAVRAQGAEAMRNAIVARLRKRAEVLGASFADGEIEEETEESGRWVELLDAAQAIRALPIPGAEVSRG
jgi:hypothetical protein